MKVPAGVLCVCVRECVFVCVFVSARERVQPAHSGVCIVFRGGEDSSVGADDGGVVAGEGRPGSLTDGTLPPVNGSSTSLTCLPPPPPPCYSPCSGPLHYTLGSSFVSPSVPLNGHLLQGGEGRG